MLIIDTLPLGDYQTNCYIVRREDSRKALILDPGYEPEIILSFLEENHLTPEAIALTHGHFDHVGAVKELAAETGCRVYLNEKDLAMPPMMTAGPLFYTDTYAEGDQLTLAEIPVTVLETPGHTPGSVCLVMEQHLFSGDTLFAASCGRTDLPGGNARAMKESLARLAALKENYQVHPGHGHGSTLDWEKKTNPYL